MIKPLLLLILLIVILSSCTSPSPAVEKLGPSPQPRATRPLPTRVPTPTIRPTSPADAYAFEQNRKLGRGVNLGNALEAPNEGEWGMVLEEAFFELIRSAGFNSVRIPIRWNAHALDEDPYTIDEEFFTRVDWAIDQALQNGLAVVINIHHYEDIMEDPAGHAQRFLAIWEQIAERYRDYPSGLYFELLNEPNGTLSNTSWNEFAGNAIETIRKTNPDRIIVIGPGNWNSLDMLPLLELPPQERNIIVTFHYYQPFHFTHQGAEWVADSEPWLGTTWEGTEAEEMLLGRDFDRALKWSQENARPILLGEFGAYSKADMDSRARWTTFVARSAEARGFSWAYWEFGAGFGVYDRAAGAWVEPIRQALVPE